MRNLVTVLTFSFFTILTSSCSNEGGGASSGLDCSKIDSDQDGLSDAYEGRVTGCSAAVQTQIKAQSVGDSDFDSDKIPNYLELDSDNDGVFDLVQYGAACGDIDQDGRCDQGTSILNSPNTEVDGNNTTIAGGGGGNPADADSDGDLVVDRLDNCRQVANTNQLDTDEDKIGDACDEDMDGDGLLNEADNCALVANLGQEDEDLDDIGDVCDDDADNDGRSDSTDNCPLIANSTQINSGGNALLGDACEDRDSDNVLDDADTCPDLFQMSQLDTSGCDVDVDDDTVLNLDDNCPFVANTSQTDTNGDTFGDACTVTYVSTTTPLAIPGGQGLTSATIAISGSGTVLDVNLFMDLPHTFSADLDIYLESPSGTLVEITTDNGLANDNCFSNILFNDQSIHPITAGGPVPPILTAPTMLTCTNLSGFPVSPDGYAPEGALGAFNGESINGTWTLQVYDDLAGDGGTLNSWSLEIVTRQ